MVAMRHAMGYIVCIGRDPEPPHQKIMKTTIELIDQIAEAIDRQRDNLLAMDLTQARYSHRLTACRRLAGDAKALLEEATD